MYKTRLEFSKTGKAAYISHLDLLRVMQRALIRAGADVWHTEGFNPHVYVSGLLPLSVGHESLCEILEFILLCPAPAGLARDIGAVLPEGLCPTRAYPAVNKPALIKYAQYEIRFFSEAGLGAQAAEETRGLLDSGNITITRKSKRGERREDIGGMIIAPDIACADGVLSLKVTLPANSQDFINPDYLTGAVKALPGLENAYAAVKRTAILKEDMGKFE